MKSEKLKILFLIIFLGSFFLFPSFSFAAGTYQLEDGTTVCYEGLVPCGGTIWAPGSLVGGNCAGTQVTYPDSKCQFCHFFVMLDGILDFIFLRLVPGIAVLMLLIGGIMFFFAGGSPQTLSQAKSIITSVVMGLVIIFAAWLIVNMFFTLIGVADTNFGRGIKDWFSIPCSIAP